MQGASGALRTRLTLLYDKWVADPRRTGAAVYQQVVDVVGNASLCKKVDSQTRGLIAKLLRDQGVNGEGASAAGRVAGTEVKQFCTSMTPEGRTVIILAGAAATIVYGVMNWDEVEPKIQDALRRAKIPLSVPLDRVQLPGRLKLGVGLEGFEADYRLQRGPGTLRFQFENTFDTGASEVSATYSQRTNAGNFNAGVSYNTGGNTGNAGGAVFFEYSISF